MEEGSPRTSLPLHLRGRKPWGRLFSEKAVLLKPLASKRGKKRRICTLCKKREGCPDFLGEREKGKKPKDARKNGVPFMGEGRRKRENRAS